MLAVLKHWLEKHKWYLHIRYQPFILSAWLSARPDVSSNLSAQKKVYQSVLKNVKTKLVVDVGANEGFLTSIFCSLGFDVIAIEPSKRNFSILKIRYAQNPKIKLIHAAVSDSCETKPFFESNKDYAIGTLDEKWKKVGDEQYGLGKVYKSLPVQIQTITLDEIIKRFGVPGFVKIDVEGHEEKVIKGLSQSIPLISFEAILPYFQEETINCIEHLCSLCAESYFNYTIREQFVNKDFVLREKLIDEIKNLPAQTIEIFCSTQI
jgi:FkbM family methyltransferase